MQKPVLMAYMYRESSAVGILGDLTMGKPLTNENIYEQYVDAAFFMDQYALTLQEKLETQPKTGLSICSQPTD